jgi:nitrite reductase/ring-hydroxylating ferredoxin subunit
MLHKAIARENIKPDEIVAVEVAGQPIAFYDIDGEVLATSDACPHDFCRLSENADIVNGDEVECSCHGSRFSIRSGENVHPPASDSLPTFPTDLSDSEVYVEVGQNSVSSLAKHAFREFLGCRQFLC